ncbi:Tlc Domain-Containing Protein 5 [Manis pentadactyla]|nr:Tlc Domain-Containing Protein 5 [Manis pentadactyla]
MPCEDSPGVPLLNQFSSTCWSSVILLPLYLHVTIKVKVSNSLFTCTSADFWSRAFQQEEEARCRMFESWSTSSEQVACGSDGPRPLKPNMGPATLLQVEEAEIPLGFILSLSLGWSLADSRRDSDEQAEICNMGNLLKSLTGSQAFSIL